MRKHILLGVSAVVILATGCASMDDTQRRTATGAGVGALAGAVIGSATGGNAGTGAVLGAGVGALGTYIWSQNMERQKREMEQATRGTGIAVSQTADNQLMLNIPSDISFDRNSATLQPELRSVLGTFATGLTQNGSGMIVRIVGHTDSTGNDAINNPLSLQRAESVKSFLNDRGVPNSRIETAGRGSHEPIASNANATGQAKNRRVEIFLRDPAQQ